MIKQIKRLFCLLVLIVCSLFLVACGEEEKNNDKKEEEKKVVEIKSITLNNDSEVSIDVFDFEQSEFTVTYSDDSTKTVLGSQLTISEDDMDKLFDPGIYDVELEYEGKKVNSKIAIRASEEDIMRPSSACYVISDSHYINGVQYTSIYVGGNEQSLFLAFEFKLKYNKDEVKNIKIIPSSDYNGKIKYDDNGERISVTFVNSNPGKINTEIFKIEYESEKLYKNFSLDLQSDYGFYRLANNDVHILTTSFNMNW